MYTSRIGVLLALVGALLLTGFPSHAAEKPNVVFFLVDDLGYTDLGCFGSTFYETPNVDRLAESGMKFTAAYAACPVCSPTRASIMTGRYPTRTGVTDFIGAKQPRAWDRNTQLLPAQYKPQLDFQETTLAEALKVAGYATFFAGKWHLGPEGHWPEDQGFDVNRGGIDRGGPYGGNKYFSPYGNPRLDDGPEGEHLPARLAEETCRFIDAHRDGPFLAYLSFYSVHVPLMAREDLREKYRAKAERAGNALLTRWGQERNQKVRLVQNHAVYAGMVEAMDQAVGSVLDKLEELGIEDETLVFFTSDNGGLSTAEGHPTSNIPLRAGKGWMYEGGIRVPTIARVPGVTAVGAVCDVPFSSTDYFPTILELTGCPTTDVDGRSIVPLLRGDTLDRGPLFWHYPHYGNQGGAPSGAARDGKWKLIEWYEDNSVELFDLEADISESNNVARDQPQVTERLRTLLADWRTSTGARMPTPNPGFRP